MNPESKNGILLPWTWLLAFLVLGVSGWITDWISLELAPLIVPLAALMGYKYGRRGLVVVAISGFCLVPELSHDDVLFLGGHSDLWLLSLLACLATQSGKAWEELTAVRHFSSARLAMVLLLPITAGLWGREFGDFSISIPLTLHYFLFALLFIAGMAGVSFLRVGVALVIMVGVSLCLNESGLVFSASNVLDASRADLPLVGSVDLEFVYLNYFFRDGYGIVTALAYFIVGRVCGPFLSSSRPPAKLISVPLIAMLVVVAAGMIPLSYITAALNEVAESMVLVFQKPDVTASTPPGPLGIVVGPIVVTASFRHYGVPVTTLFPLLGFLSGLLYAWRGTLWTLLALFAVWVVETALQGHFPKVLFPVSAVLVLLGYSSLGVAIRNTVTGSRHHWWSCGWIVYIVLAVVFLIDRGTDFFSVQFVALLFIAVVLGLFAERLFKWLHQETRRFHGGWVALLAIVGALSLAWGHVLTMSSALAALIGAATFGPMLYEFENRHIVGLVAIVALWLLLTALRVFVKRIPEIVRDLRRAAVVIKAALKRRPIPPAPQAAPADTMKPWWHPERLLQWLGDIVKWAGVAIALGAFARPTFEALQESQRERTERAVESADQTRVANPMLLRAATEVFEEWGFEFDKPGWRGSHYETGWYVDASEPDIRRRSRVSLDAELGDDPVSVYVDMRRKRYGIWVEVPGDFELEDETASQLERRIVLRARELAGQQPPQAR